MLRHLLAVLLLPFNVLVTVPALLLWATGGLRLPSSSGFSAGLGVLLAAAGLALMGTTVALFARVGRGTLAPWSPPERLVVRGPYRRVRNPMISGVLLVLLGEASMLRSPWLLAWWALFFAGNALWIPWVEEPGLEARFGEAWRSYARRVPRWVPRLVPAPPEPPECGPAGDAGAPS